MVLGDLTLERNGGPLGAPAAVNCYVLNNLSLVVLGGQIAQAFEHAVQGCNSARQGSAF